MQCRSFTPVYYHARDLNVGAGGYSWHPYDTNASHGEERGYTISMALCDQYSGYDKEVLKKIMLNQEATFRYQVQELHRLYIRQRDLMDETRMRENLEEPTTLGTDSFTRKNSFNDVQLLFPCCKQDGNENIRLELAAAMYHDDKVKQFKVGDLYEAPAVRRTPEEISNFWPPSDSDNAAMTTWDVSSSCSNIRKTNYFIDLNEPVQLESMPATSSDPLESFTSSIPVEAIPESVVPTLCQLRKSNGSSSYGINPSMNIDLNSMPVNCFSETEMNLESPPSVNRKAEVVLDCSFGYNRAMRIVHGKISDSFLKAETYMNSGVVEEHSLPLSASTLEIKSAEDTELKGPVSPENEESSPPRGKSEDTQLETPLSSEQGVGEPLIEVETIAAETLANMGSAVFFYPLTNFRNLCWFAEFASSTGDDLENLPHFKKAKGTGTVSRSSGNDQKRGKKPCKDSQSQECLKPGRLKRKSGKSGCAKPRKHTKLSPSDVTKKSMSSILKQSAARTDQGVLQSWGKVRNRLGGRRRRACVSFSLAELASF